MEETILQAGITGVFALFGIISTQVFNSINLKNTIEKLENEIKTNSDNLKKLIFDNELLTKEHNGLSKEHNGLSKEHDGLSKELVFLTDIAKKEEFQRNRLYSSTESSSIEIIEVLKKVSILEDFIVSLNEKVTNREKQINILKEKLSEKEIELATHKTKSKNRDDSREIER